MSAFAASFLANPFEAQALGGATDQNGNIFNANGDHVGVVPGSIADIGSKGAAVTPTSTSSSAASSPAAGSDLTAITAATPTGAGGAGSGIWAKLLDFARKATGIDAVENIVFIVLGIIIVAAGVFSFKPLRDTVVTVAKAATA
jgi:hypothetical protein